MNFDLLEKEGQSHVLRFWDKLDTARREELVSQIKGLDFASIARMRSLLSSREAGEASPQPFAPAPVEVVCEGELSRQARETGNEAISKGKVAVVLVAGGQGSRLGFDGPKGAYKIGPVSGKPLFYFHSRKILALARRFGARIPFYVMTSETNDAATRACFEENGYFGLDREDVFFFTQGMWPALDGDGRIMLDSPSHIFMSPDGHGGILSALLKSGAIGDMERRGIESVFYFQVDNPMVAVADPLFVGMHLLREADISIKVCAKRDAAEGLGIVVNRGGKFAMVEYTELTDAQKNRRSENGDLYFKYGSVAIHLFSFAFLKRECSSSLPLHIAHKKIPYCLDDGTVAKPSSPNGYKFEKFVFDVIPDAAKVLNIAFEREDEFSPVKNADGCDSPDSCKRDLQAKWARWFEACGVKIPRKADGLPAVSIEIDPASADSREALAKYLEIHSVDVTSTINI